MNRDGGNRSAGDAKLKNTPEIGILLGVYNGADFLDAQIQSYLDQDHEAWQVLARDDGSKDASLKILNQYALKDGRIHIRRDGNGNLGVRGNFSALMGTALDTDIQYFVFSDQDDVWRHDKLSAQLEVMRGAEAVWGKKPVLVHSDAMVVDRELNTISPSFMAYQGIRHNSAAPLNNLLVQNFVTGCTIMVNRQLLEMAYPVPETALMHDWWLALCAAVFGTIAFVDKPLIQYRQHADNQVGAKSVARCLNPFTGNGVQIWASGRRHLARSVLQAKALAERMGAYEGCERQIRLVRAYASLLKLSPLNRVRFLRRHNIRSQTLIREVLMISRWLVIPRQ